MDSNPQAPVTIDDKAEAMALLSFVGYTLLLFLIGYFVGRAW